MQPIRSAAGGVGGPSLKTFQDEAAVESYLCNLANELMLVSDNKPAAIFKTSDEDPVESLGKMVSVLDSAGHSLADVQSRAERHVSYLQVSIRNGSTCTSCGCRVLSLAHPQYLKDEHLAMHPEGTCKNAHAYMLLESSLCPSRNPALHVLEQEQDDRSSVP